MTVGDSRSPSIGTAHASLWRRLLAFAGPAYLVSVGYMDPGNWATDLEAGSKFGYHLVWVLVVANGMAILFQTLSVRLGVVSGRDLAQACRYEYPRPISLALWALCEIGIAACDLAEVLGAAIALNLLFGLPLLIGVLVTVADTLVLLWLQQSKMRTMEGLVLRMIVIVTACLGMEIFLAKPAAGEIAVGMVPRLNRDSLYIALAMMGATVMPHNLYLHSALVQTRRIGKTSEAKRRACRYNLVDTLMALNGAMFVNIALLVLAAAVFFKRGQIVTEFHQVIQMLEPALGTKAASVIFAVALLTVGQASALTGTMAGQIVMEGFLNLRMRAWLRRLFTRLLAILPAVFAIYFYGEIGAFRLLILSQVVLSMQLPFAIIPLLHFTGDRRRMGEFASGRWLHGCAAIVAGVIIVLNISLAVKVILDWRVDTTPEKIILSLLVPLFVALVLLLVYLLVTPRLKQPETAPAWHQPDTAAPGRAATAYLEQVKADDELHSSETRFGVFMEQLRGIAFIKDPQGRYVYFNAACSTLLGLDIDEALDKTDDELWPPELAGVYKKNDQTVFLEGKPFEGIEPILQNGEPRSWMMYKFPVVEGESQQVFLGAVGVEIADREHLEERVLQSRKFELVGQMAGGIAHHFNNLLMVISGYTRMTLDELGPNHKARGRLEEVLGAAESAADLTSQLLTFSRRGMLQYREVDLNQVVRDAEPAVRRILGAGIQLRVDLSQNPARVRADAKFMERVIAALALNARDAMKTPGGLVTIATSNVQSGRLPCAKLSIQDTGAGMDEDTKMHLFEPFFTTKAPGEGAGLGLSSAYGIVKQHGGEITVESRLGVGTTFDIFLPVLPASDAEPRAKICAHSRETDH